MVGGGGGSELDPISRPIRSYFKRWAKPKNVDKSKNASGIKGQFVKIGPEEIQVSHHYRNSYLR